MPPFGEQVSGHLLVLSSLGSVSPPLVVFSMSFAV